MPPHNESSIPNGSGAAAMLATAIGSFALAVLAFVADKSVDIKNSLNFYRPTGPLSGVSTVAILVWLSTWFFLEQQLGRRTVAIGRISAASLTLLVLSILLTFPPIVDLL